LLQGTYLAAEQAGRLSSDSKLLYENKRVATAYAVAVACIEEIGKSRRYLELTDIVRGGGTVMSDQVKFVNHKEKIETGLTAPVFSHTWGEPEPGSADEKAIIEKLDEDWRTRPRNTHNSRMDAVYVDFKPSSGQWSSPARAIDPEDVRITLTNAKSDYSLLRLRLLRKIDDDAVLREIASRINLPLLEPV
jgi:AbiV family abortive infection protein